MRRYPDLPQIGISGLVLNRVELSGGRWTGSHRKKSLLLRLDQPVATLAAAVDDVHLVRIGVAENKEVMADELQLEHRLFGIHRLDRELLRPDDLRFFGHLESFVGCLPAGTPAPASLLAVSRDLSLELVDETVDRGAHVLRALARA